MSYKIDSYSLKEYVTRKWIKIPRFQRAKTWNEKQKFELVLSVFKKYPLGCVILCKEKGQDSEYLIDGRQRYSALQEMLTSPDIVYGWAQKYLSLKKGDVANVIADKFWEKVRDFTDYSPNDELESSEDEQNDDSIENAEDENEDRKALISSIYTRILKASTPKGFVKWDLPASLPFALKKNQNFDFLFPISSIKDDSASKLITLGFKISSGIILGGIKKEDLDKLGKSTEINEDTFATLESDIKRMLVSMLNIPYFEVYESWSLSLSRLIGDAPTLCFLFMTYHMFKIESKPEPSDNNFRLFKRNCIAIIDRLIFEYVRSQWKGSSDSLLAKELANFIKNYTKGTQIETISEQSWRELLDDICNNGEVNHKPISFGLVKPLIAHYNAIKQLKCDISYDFKPEFDHIIPQTAFGDKKDKTQSKLRDNLFNLALLPKVSNASKNDRPLQDTLSNESLVSNIEKYEEIKKEDFAKFNKRENIDALKEYRLNNFYKAFGEFRNDILK